MSVAPEPRETIVVEARRKVMAWKRAWIARRARKRNAAAAGRMTGRRRIIWRRIGRRGIVGRGRSAARAVCRWRWNLSAGVADAVGGGNGFDWESNQRTLDIDLLRNDDIHIANHALTQTLLDRARPAVVTHAAAAEMQRQAARDGGVKHRVVLDGEMQRAIGGQPGFEASANAVGRRHAVGRIVIETDEGSR